MDPVTTAIVAALAAGVAGGATEVGKKVMVDAYDALKAALKQTFGADSDLVETVEHLEKKPEARTRQAGVEEEVKVARADEDAEVLAAAQALLEALKNTPEGQKAISKFQIDVSGGQVGVIGDQTKVEGGLHFGGSKSET